MDSWIIVVRTPLGNLRRAAYSYDELPKTIQEGATVVSVTPQVEYIQSARGTLTPEGSCLDGEIIAGAANSYLDIRPFDIVEIQTIGIPALGEVADRHYIRYSGKARVTSYRAQGEGVPQRISLVGHQEDLRHCWTGRNYDVPAGTDIGKAAFDIINKAKLHESLIKPTIADTFATVTTAAVNPSSLDLWANLETLAGFAEANGERSAFGVNVDRRVFFRARLTTTLSIAEANLGVVGGKVVWREPPAYEHVNEVCWLVASSSVRHPLFGGTPLAEDSADVLTYTPPKRPSAYGTRTLSLQPPRAKLGQAEGNLYVRPIPVGLSIVTGVLHASFSGLKRDASPVFSRISDGDSTSYAVFRATRGLVVIRLNLPNGFNASDVAQVGVSLKTDGSSGEILSHLAHLRGTRVGGGGNIGLTHPNIIEVKGAPDYEELLVLGDRLRTYGAIDASHVELHISLFPTDVEAYIAIADFRLWELDKPALGAAALREYAEPPDTAFDLRLVGPQVAYGNILLTEISGNTLGLKEVDSISLELNESGVRNVYHVTPPEDPEELEQAALERRFRQRIQ